jgi:hypothetical protein
MITVRDYVEALLDAIPRVRSKHRTVLVDLASRLEAAPEGYWMGDMVRMQESHQRIIPPVLILDLFEKP